MDFFYIITSVLLFLTCGMGGEYSSKGLKQDRNLFMIYSFMFLVVFFVTVWVFYHPI